MKRSIISVVCLMCLAVGILALSKDIGIDILRAYSLENEPNSGLTSQVVALLPRKVPEAFLVLLPPFFDVEESFDSGEGIELCDSGPNAYFRKAVEELGEGSDLAMAIDLYCRNTKSDILRMHLLAAVVNSIPAMEKHLVEVPAKEWLESQTFSRIWIDSSRTEERLMMASIILSLRMPESEKRDTLFRLLSSNRLHSTPPPVASIDTIAKTIEEFSALLPPQFNGLRDAAAQENFHIGEASTYWVLNRQKAIKEAIKTIARYLIERSGDVLLQTAFTHRVVHVLASGELDLILSCSASLGDVERANHSQTDDIRQTLIELYQSRREPAIVDNSKDLLLPGASRSQSMRKLCISWLSAEGD
jgi:hypothetical protein